MGYEFMVYSYLYKEELDDYENELIYCGSNYNEAIKTMKEQKESGVGYVKLEWR